MEVLYVLIGLMSVGLFIYVVRFISYDTTSGVTAFIIAQLYKYDELITYGSLDLNQAKRQLKKRFKPHLDFFLYVNTNFKKIAIEVKKEALKKTDGDDDE